LQGALFRGPDGDAGKVENVASAFNYNGAKGAGLGINAISGRRPPETGAKPAGQHFISASSKNLELGQDTLEIIGGFRFSMPDVLQSKVKYIKIGSLNNKKEG